MKLTLGFSPCPNDTFIFDAMIHQKIETEGLEFEVVMEDVEKLNQMAFAGELDITKLSYHAFGYLTEKYILLNAGSALGKNCGPLLIARPEFDFNKIETANIAIPGKNTTANFLLRLAYPDAVNKTELLFSDIENAVLSGEVDCGLIIHENRFTYAEKGLIKIRDLGEYWEETTRLPIPLGGIVAKRNLNIEILNKIDRVLKRSVEYAFENPKSSLPFIRQHAQEMEEEVMYQHIHLYVNDYSVDLGEEGRKAISKMYKIALEKKVLPSIHSHLFLNH